MRRDRTRYRQLGAETVRPTDPGALWRTAVFTAVFFLGLNLIARAYLDRFSHDQGLWSISRKWAMASSAGDADWIALGDSGCTCGVDPAAMGSAGRVLNLCSTVAAGLAFNTWMLERYLENGGSADGLLLMNTPAGWVYEMRPRVAAQVPVPGWYLRDSSRRSAIVEGSWPAALGFRYFPLLSEASNLRGIVADPSVWFASPLELTPAGHLPFREPIPDGVATDAAAFVESIRGRPFELDPGSGRRLDGLLERAGRAGIPVVLALSPVTEAVVATEDGARYLREVIDALEAVASRHAGVEVLDEVRIFPAAVMQDPWHLTAPAAAEFSGWLAERLAGASPAMR